MTKSIFQSFTVLNGSMLGSGMAAHNSCNLFPCLNNNYLYAHKNMEAGFGATVCNKYNDQWTVQFTVAGGGSDSYSVGKIRIPPSLSGVYGVSVITSGSGTAGAGQLSFRNGTAVDAQIQLSAVAQTVDLGGSNEYEITWDSRNNGGAGGSEVLESVAIYFGHKEALGKITSTAAAWQPLKQTYCDSANLKPLSSYLLQKIAGCHAHILCEASSTWFSRYVGLPWTRATSYTKVADYRFRCEKHTKQSHVYFYARAVENDGLVKVLWNGGALVTDEVITSTWAWFGPYAATHTADAANQLTIEAKRTGGDGTSGHGVQVAGVYAWEIAVPAADLNLPAGDSVPIAFSGSDTTGGSNRPIVADTYSRFPGDSVDSGFKTLTEDMVYLKSKRRRMLVCDWRHRTLSDGYFTNNVRALRTDFNDTISWQGDAGGFTNGSILALAMLPAPSDFPYVEVWLQVAVENLGSDALRTWELQVTGDNASTATRTVTTDDTFDAARDGATVRWVGPFTVEADGITVIVKAEARYVLSQRDIAAGGVGDGSLMLHGMYVRQRPPTEVP